MPSSEILAVGASELSLVLLLMVVVVVPIATVAFARSGKGYAEIGKGRFAVDFGEDEQAHHHEEVRQLVEAKAFRQEQRGEDPVDIEQEIERLLQGESPGTGTGSAPSPEHDAPEPNADPETAAVREEIRQVVLAKNESRLRRGEQPLDVEAEVGRMLSEFG